MELPLRKVNGRIIFRSSPPECTISRDIRRTHQISIGPINGTPPILQPDLYNINLDVEYTNDFGFKACGTFPSNILIPLFKRYFSVDFKI